MSQIPWDRLSRDTLKAVIKDFGLAPYTKYARRHADFIKLLRDIETDGLESVVQRLQERAEAYAAREESPEIDFVGGVAPASARTAAVRPHPRPVVEISSRAGPSTRPREDESASARRHSGGPPPAKKARIPPPSYAILHQLQQVDSSPSAAAPAPLARPNQLFEGVVLSSPPRKARGAHVQSASAHARVVHEGGIGSISATSMRFEAVEVTVPVEAVKRQWMQSSSGRRAVG